MAEELVTTSWHLSVNVGAVVGVVEGGIQAWELWNDYRNNDAPVGRRAVIPSVLQLGFGMYELVVRSRCVRFHEKRTLYRCRRSASAAIPRRQRGPLCAAVSAGMCCVCSEGRPPRRRSASDWCLPSSVTR